MKLDLHDTVEVPEGSFIMGSSLDERALALERSYSAQGRVFPEASTWIKNELSQRELELDAFHIMRYPVTQIDYLSYVRNTGAPEPYLDPDNWQRQQTGIEYEQVQRFTWKNGQPSEARKRHPVVLVSQVEALRYCQWWGKKRGGRGNLPTEKEWEKAARGQDGRLYPWGERYHPGYLNASEAGPGDTVTVGLFAEGASPYGALDMAGNVFEWTRTHDQKGEYVVKGGAWSSDAGFVRAAARHTRPQWTKHITIGFRCVLRPPEDKKEGGQKSGKKSEQKRDTSHKGRESHGKGEARAGSTVELSLLSSRRMLRE